MNRTTKFKFLYICALLALGGASILVLNSTNYNPLVIIGLAVVLLLPGRVCGHYWRDFLKGRNLMTQGRFSEAEKLFEAFLLKLKEKTWIKTLIIFSWGMYTRDIEVMTLNNLGVIKIEEGHFKEAEEFLDRAIKKDEKAPLPYFNLALIAAVEGKDDLAEELFQKSKERGFTGSSVDQLIRQAGELHARIEGRINTEPVAGGDATRWRS